jgi:putative FmdB family regulatory protein
MPIYEYACDTCQSTFERKQKFSDEPVRTCPECGNEVRRVLYPAGIIFKGSGFYVTDNRSGSSSGTERSASNGSSTADSSSDSSSSTDSSSTTKATAAADS